MISESLKRLCELFKSYDIAYAILEADEARSWILCGASDRDGAIKLIKKAGYKEDKAAFNKDKYLYGLEPFRCFTGKGHSVVLCCGAACRSTLNGEWVPLDRKINIDILKRVRNGNAGFPVPGYEDELCYLLAKCVYTQKSFSAGDIERIGECLAHADKEVLMPKLEGVFFRFSERVLEMAKKGEYEDIIPSLFKFADY